MDMVFCGVYLHIRITVFPPSGIVTANPNTFIEEFPGLVAVIALDESDLFPGFVFIHIHP